jgi:hypothetical protein
MPPVPPVPLELLLLDEDEDDDDPVVVVFPSPRQAGWVLLVVQHTPVLVPSTLHSSPDSQSRFTPLVSRFSGLQSWPSV